MKSLEKITKIKPDDTFAISFDLICIVGTNTFVSRAKMFSFSINYINVQNVKAFKSNV